MSRSMLRRLFVTVTGGLVACSSGCSEAPPSSGDANHLDGGAERDAALDVGDGDGDDASSSANDPDASLSSCQLEACPAPQTAKWKTLLRARDLEATARFIAIDKGAVLALAGNGDAHVALLESPAISESVTYATWTATKGALTPVAITSGTLEGSVVPEPFVLYCNEGHSQCEILHGQRGQNQLRSFSASPLPAGFVAQGLVVDAAASPVTLCAYGNGIVCLDQTWEARLPISAGLVIRHVSVGPGWSLAVGDDGRWYKRERLDSGELGAWTSQSVIDNAKLSYAVVSFAGGLILGEGRIQAALGSEEARFRCRGPENLSGIVLYQAAPGVADVVTESGTILQRGASSDAYCATQQIDEGGVIGVTSDPCGASANPRLLTSSTIVGQHLCVFL